MSFRNILPNELKLSVRLVRRSIADLINGYAFNFAREGESSTTFAHKLSKTQEIKKIAGVEEKIYNLTKAATLIQAIEVRPGEVFSFWKTVGIPTEGRGFKKGRTIVNGQVSESIGGGLCQLSGLIYYLSLEADLTVLERHNHSLDLYNDETRFAPLGSDAAVVYGYKDLRILNRSNSRIKFSFQVSDDKVEASLLSENPIPTKSVSFVMVNDVEREDFDVITLVNDNKTVISTYRRKSAQ